MSTRVPGLECPQAIDPRFEQSKASNYTTLQTARRFEQHDAYSSNTTDTQLTLPTRTNLYTNLENKQLNYFGTQNIFSLTGTHVSNP